MRYWLMNNGEGFVLSGELIFYAHTLDTDFKELLLVPISDVHYGNHLFSKYHFSRTVKYIQETPNAVTILNGDLSESTIKSSKGDIFKQAGTPQDQRDWVRDKLEPIKEKILGMTIGNHELRIYNETGIDLCKDIARDLGIPYRPEGMLLKVSFGDNNDGVSGRPYTYWHYFTHGYGGARTASAKAVKVERTSTYVHADCYEMSHDHVVNAAPVVYLMPDSRTHKQLGKDGDETGFNVGKVTAKRKMLVKTNAYIKWGGYAEMGGFAPSDLSCPIIKHAGTGKPGIKVEI